MAKHDEVKLATRPLGGDLVILAGQRIASVQFDEGCLYLGLDSGITVKISAQTDDPYACAELEIAKLG
jgi:hypothetical protein